MTLDYQMLRYLRERNPAWRLLCSDHAALIAAVLNRAFIVPNVRVIGAAALAEALADEMFAISDLDGTQFPQTPIEYLNDWASPSKGWLRSFYKPGTDEQQFDLMPSTEKVLAWLASKAGCARFTSPARTSSSLTSCHPPRRCLPGLPALRNAA